MLINFRLAGKKGILGYTLLLLGFSFFFISFVQIKTRDNYVNILINEPYGFRYLPEESQDLLWFARMDFIDDINLTSMPISLDNYDEYERWIYSAKPIVKKLNVSNISEAYEELSKTKISIMIFTLIGLISHLLFVISLPFTWDGIRKIFVRIP
tara:strand:- start:1781 stop:2242 length:462 start_codon:yes stop_codon:yes gene_type:complete